MGALAGTASRRRIYLLRHGHVNYLKPAEGGWNNVPLTELGQAQAKASGEALKGVRFDRALCSGYPRTRQTAEIVLSENRYSAKLEVDADFREVTAGSGRPEISSFEDLTIFMTASFDDAHESGAQMGNAADSDVFEEVQARALQALKRLLDEDDWTTSLIVAHEGINRLLLSWAVGSGLRSAGRIEQDLAGINIIDFDPVEQNWEDKSLGLSLGFRPIVKAVNLTPYSWIKADMPLTSFEYIFRPQ